MTCGERRSTSFFLSWPLISSVVNSPSVPTICLMKVAGSVIAEAVDAVRPDADRPELGVAHHDRRRWCPSGCP
jgi:hypothetical protein